MARVEEIAPDLFRISIFAGAANLQFNHFLVRDDEPLLMHTGLRGMFREVREAVERLAPAAKLRHIAFSHFEADECGSLPEWLAVAPEAQPACSQVGALVSVGDQIGRPVRGLADGESFATGRYRFRFCQTRHLPHGWDAGVFFEETQRTLLCSDLFHQNGDVEALTHDDVVERSRAALRQYQAGVLAGYVPYTPHTGRLLRKLAELRPATLAIMHGSSFAGDGAAALLGLDEVYRELFGGGAEAHSD
jgi:flavorubredoxin